MKFVIRIFPEKIHNKVHTKKAIQKSRETCNIPTGSTELSTYDPYRFELTLSYGVQGVGHNDDLAVAPGAGEQVTVQLSRVGLDADRASGVWPNVRRREPPQATPAS